MKNLEKLRKNINFYSFLSSQILVVFEDCDVNVPAVSDEQKNVEKKLNFG
jgi:hypothetical protein